MNRGEIWTISGGPGIAGKPRPAAIIQSEAFGGTQTVTVCALTSDSLGAHVIRPTVAPTAENGLTRPCEFMVDKLTTIPRARLGKPIGRLSPDDQLALDRAILLFLGLAG